MLHAGDLAFSEVAKILGYQGGYQNSDKSVLQTQLAIIHASVCLTKPISLSNQINLRNGHDAEAKLGKKSDWQLTIFSRKGLGLICILSSISNNFLSLLQF